MIETNHKKIAHKLKKKGWDAHSISHSIKILKKAEKNKPAYIKKMDSMIYWLFLVLIMIGNAMIFFGIIPILIYSPDWVSILILGLLGLCVGFFIDVLIKHHDFKHHHYFNAILSITTVAVASLFLILFFIKPIIATKHWYIHENPFLLLVSYVIGSVIPHIIFKVREIKNGP